MAWWRRGRSKQAPHGGGDLASAQAHFEDFIRTRRGVEAYVEPATNITATTVVLIAHDGEWTRRHVPGVQWAHTFANKRGIPSYDAAVVGIPPRMREYNRRKKQQALDRLDEL